MDTPGLALGPAHRNDHHLTRIGVRRVPLDQVERELNRFHQALSASKSQLEGLKKSLRGVVPDEHVLILDTHVAYLRDSVFLSDVENLIHNEQMSLEGAIAKVINDFDRIFRLVQSETLRERAVDLRDVGIRVLRNLERADSAREAATASGAKPAAGAAGASTTAATSETPDAPDAPDTGDSDHILVARELSIVDMFHLDNRRVRGILTEEGSLTGHAAILARSMRIPTLTGVEGLIDEVAEGDFLIVDASEGVVRIEPDEHVRAQYQAERERVQASHESTGRPAWARHPARTRDGETIEITSACGNLPEVERAAQLGLTEVGLYRTELLYLIDREQPSIDSLVAHYESVLDQGGSGGVTFRLLDVDSSLRLPYLHSDREPNPALGRTGVRLLLEHENVLRRQLRAVLRARPEARARLALPKVTDVGDLRRVRELLFEERFALGKSNLPHRTDIAVGAVLELPSALIGAADLADEADFLVVNLSSMQQYLLAVDRALATPTALHPYVVRVLIETLQAAAASNCSLTVFGIEPVVPETLELLLGVGLKRFAVPISELESFMKTVARIELDEARSRAERVAGASCPADLNPDPRKFV
jgi:phosphotransferase system enzyme I (PtsI)